MYYKYTFSHSRTQKFGDYQIRLHEGQILPKGLPHQMYVIDTSVSIGLMIKIECDKQKKSG